MKKRLITIITILLFTSVSYGNEAVHLKKVKWPFEGMFGYFDRQAAQRGFKVYKEVCSVCHSLKLVAYRNLAEIGFSEAEIKAIAAEKTVKDGPNDEGEMFDRAARPSDQFVSPYANDQAARAANNGALPTDQSLVIKAREDGANYLYSLITGYNEKMPEGFKLAEGLYYNPYFPAQQIAMPAPLNSDGQVVYEDGTKSTIDQMAKDVVVFLQWAAEPEMEERKKMGLKTMMFLAVLTIFFYIAKKNIWSRLDNDK